MDVQLLKIICRTLDWVVSINKKVIKGSSATVEFMIFFPSCLAVIITFLYKLFKYIFFLSQVNTGLNFEVELLVDLFFSNYKMSSTVQMSIMKNDCCNWPLVGIW